MNYLNQRSFVTCLKKEGSRLSRIEANLDDQFDFLGRDSIRKVHCSLSSVIIELQSYHYLR